MRRDAHSSWLRLLAPAFSLGVAQSVSTAKHLALPATILAFLLTPAALNAVTIAGSFQYESDQPGSPSLPAGTYYDVTNLSLQVGAYHVDTNTALIIYNTGSGDGFELNGVVYGPIIDGYILDYLVIGLFDSTGMVFSDESLPTSLSLSGFDSPYISLTFISSEQTVGVSGIMTAFSVPVPEPSTGLLVISGLLGVGVWRRRRA